MGFQKHIRVEISSMNFIGSLYFNSLICIRKWHLFQLAGGRNHFSSHGKRLNVCAALIWKLNCTVNLLSELWPWQYILRMDQFIGVTQLALSTIIAVSNFSFFKIDRWSFLVHQSPLLLRYICYILWVWYEDEKSTQEL